MGMGQFPLKLIKRFFRDAGLLDEVVMSVSHDRDHMDKLAADFADEISSILKKDPDFKKRVLEGTILNPKFEKEVLQKIRKKAKGQE